ncbi:MAG: DUF4912 domain-containing protein [Candidatus Omnitrophica bacterium]|nr:DUF4912 domain-containing protein [Candidatus Omnitrophota bacterium]
MRKKSRQAQTKKTGRTKSSRKVSAKKVSSKVKAAPRIPLLTRNIERDRRQSFRAKIDRLRRRLLILEHQSAEGKGERQLVREVAKIESEIQRLEERASFYPAPHKKLEESAFSFPSGYGDHKIVLLVRDPWWIHAYWEVNREVEERTLHAMREKGLSPQKSVLRVYDVTGIDFNGRNAHRFFDIGVSGLAKNWYIEVGEPNRDFIVDLGIVAHDGSFHLLCRSNRVTTPRFGMSEVVDEEWMTSEDDYWKLFGLSGGYGIGKSSLEMKEFFKKHLLEQVSSGGASGFASFFKMKEKERSFWLKVDCELIVYGATDPKASVSVQHQPIRLNPDGTFSLRYTLPDGKQEIKIEAKSPDEVETRRVSPIVTRQTV